MILAVACSLALTACFDDPIKKSVDAKFPPVDADQYRKEALATGFRSLSAMQSPDVAAVLRLDDIREAIKTSEALQENNVKDVKIEGDRQILFADIEVDGVFTSAMFPDLDVDSAAILDAAQPKVVGSLQIGASIKSAVVADNGSDLSLEFHLLPLFREVRIDELKVAEKVGLEEPADFIAKIINRFADNISGELSRAEFARITVPASPGQSLQTSVEDSETFDDGTRIDLKVTGQPVSSPLYAKAVGFKIDAAEVAVLIDLSPTSETAPARSETAQVSSFSDFSAAFDERISNLVAANERPNTTWAALAKSSLSQLLNSGFRQAELCVDVNASVPRQDFSKKVEIPDENTIDCTPTVDCTSTRDCTPSRSCEQTEDCRACLLRAPRVCVPNIPSGQTCHGGHCIKEGLDPACQLRKAGRKADCERLKSQEKAQCETEKAVEKAACEAEKAGKKGLCETGKEALKRLSRTGNVANVDSFAEAVGQIRICVANAVFTPDLERVDLTFDMSGQANARVGIKWTSLDIAGYVTCPAGQWTEHKDIAVTVPPQDVNVETQLNYVVDDESLSIEGNVETSKLKVALRPTPRELIFENYNMELSCPLVGGLLELVKGGTLVVDASRAIPEFNGNFTLPGMRRSFEFEVEPIMVEIPSTTMSATAFMSTTDQSVLVQIKR